MTQKTPLDTTSAQLQISWISSSVQKNEDAASDGFFLSCWQGSSEDFSRILLYPQNNHLLRTLCNGNIVSVSSKQWDVFVLLPHSETPLAQPRARKQMLH